MMEETPNKGNLEKLKEKERVEPFYTVANTETLST
jgi:hypothetical protein